MALALLLGALLYVATLIVLTPWFATSDDRTMMGIASGTTYGAPSEHVTFLHILYGLLLKHAYLITDGVPWYGLLLYGLQLVAIVAILWSLISTCRGRIPCLWFALAGVLVVFLAPMTLRLQYTQVALLLGIAGVVVHSAALATARRTWTLHAAAGALVAAGVLVRWESLWAIAIGAVPLLAWQLRPTKGMLLRLGLFAGVAAILVGSAGLFEHRYYSTRPEWREYLEFNRERHALHDTPRLEDAEQSPDVLDEIGWSANDRAMFSGRFHPDAALYTTEDLRTIRTELAPRFTDPPDVPGTVSELAHTYRWQSVAVLGATALAALATGWRGRLWLAAATGWSFAFLTYLTTFVRLPLRVAAPLLLLTAVTALLIGARPDGLLSTQATPQRASTSAAVRRARGVLAASAVLLMAAGSVALIPTMTRQSSDAAARSAERHATVERLRAFLDERDEAVVVGWAGALDVGIAPPLTTRRDLHDVDWIALGWHQLSPDWHEHAASLGVDDVVEGILFDPDVYLAAQQRDRNRLDTFAQEHYGVSLEFERVLEQEGRQTHVWAVRVADDRDDAPES